VIGCCLLVKRTVKEGLGVALDEGALEDLLATQEREQPLLSYQVNKWELVVVADYAEEATEEEVETTMLQGDHLSEEKAGYLSSMRDRHASTTILTSLYPREGLHYQGDPIEEAGVA
jgi:hypothetical protein